MKGKPLACARIADDLLAAAIGDAEAGAAHRVERHLAACVACRREFQEYRAVDHAVIGLRNGPPEPALFDARERLETRLTDLRRRLLRYRIFPSPLGNLLIARSEVGVSLVEYLERGHSVQGSRLRREPGVEMAEGGQDLEAIHRELLEYLDGRRRRLAWPLDLRLARTAFHRAVLEATAAVPYGAVIPYAGIANEIGKASASRAVAQALRWNPLPIVIPCHRVVGTSGALTGYAGTKVGLKQRLLSIEGVPTGREAGALFIRPQAMYVLYPGDREYCVPACPSLETRRRMPLTRFASRERAEGAGLSPCGICRPDLHPLAP